MSYANDLLNDFESEDDNSVGSDNEVVEEEVNQNDTSTDVDTLLESILNNPLRLEERLNLLDVDTISDPSAHLQVLKIKDAIFDKIKKFESAEESDYLKLISYSDDTNDEYRFFVQINRITQLIHSEMAFVFNYIRFNYKIVFPELESIIPSPTTFIKIIELVKQDLISIRDFESELKAFLPADKILLIIMSGLQNATKQFKLKDEEFNVILLCCEQYQELDQIVQKLSKFIQIKAVNYTPNLINLLGPVTASQLLLQTGSLQLLSTVPSCNVSSIGVKEMSSSAKKIKLTIPMGYLYHNDMVKFLPPEVQKLALRILSGKTILAARVDLSKSSPNGELGAKYKQEVSEKINKLLTPPEASGIKPLPKPTDYKSKRRGGKRLRKMKQKFLLSELAKAQNRMKFGDAEDTYLNTFGEEVGMGMVKDQNIKPNTQTSATMSKTMKARLENNHDERKRHLDSLFDGEDNSYPQSNEKKRSNNEDIDLKPQSKWLTGSLMK